MNHKTHYYDGQWHVGSQNSELIKSENPASGAIIWSGHAADSAAVEHAANAARKAFPAWARTPLDERIALVKRYQDVLKARQSELAEAVSNETGKQLWEAKTEIATMIGKVDLSLSSYETRTGTSNKDLNGVKATLTHRPHGVLLVLGPYNFPGHLPNGHIVPALIAGNTVIFKPSELTPYVGQLMVECWVEAGVPDGVINLLQGAGNTGAMLSANEQIDGLLFTGSSHTGAALHKQFAGQPGKILALEMGGNNPLIYDQVEDIKAAVYNTLQSAYITSGQRCTCARRLIVIRSPQGEQFVAELAEAAANISIGLPDEDDKFYGPVISNKVAEMLLDVQQNLVEKGGKPLVTMQRPTDSIPLLTPGLIDVTDIDDRVDEEYFGPLLQLIWVDNLDEAIAQANATRFGLAAGMLTDNDAHWNEFYISARAGILNRNRPTTGASGGAPFGGIGASGNHRPSAFYAADYCAYPMATMSDDMAQLPAQLSPGIKL